MESSLNVDWISVTLLDSEVLHYGLLEDMERWRDVDSGHYTLDTSVWRVSKARFGYKHAMISSCGTVAYAGTHTMGLHVQYSGQAIIALQARGITPSAIIAHWLDLGGKFTRLDVALDMKEGNNGVNDYRDCVRDGLAITPSKTWSTIEGSAGGNTLYVGSRSSDRMVRVYDKKAERAAKFEEIPLGSWIRCEVELKGDRAKATAELFRSQPYADVLGHAIRAACNFQSVPDFQSGLSGNRDIQAPKLSRKLTKTRHWILSRVAPAIAKECAGDHEFHDTFIGELNRLIDAIGT